MSASFIGFRCIVFCIFPARRLSDARLSDRDQLNAHYSLYDVRSFNSRNVGGLGAVSQGAAFADRDQTIALNTWRRSGLAENGDLNRTTWTA